MPQEEAHFSEGYFTVSEIGERAEESLLSTFPDFFWVRGELTNLSNQRNIHYSKNYIFCVLKDAQSQISLYLPSSSPAFKLIPELKDGIEVYVYGKINYYTKQNSISVRVFNIVIGGEGELKRQFEIMKQRLQNEGLFDTSHKKAIPLFPRCIGVITSPSGAVIQDILSRTKQDHGAIDVIVFPVQVQGKNAAKEIASAIETANRLFQDEIDTLIVGRGGGSVEDLWAFNEEIVARAIYASDIPIISAVGHEVDWTIADHVADYRAPTPTAAAEHLMKEIISHGRNIHHYLSRLFHQAESRLRLFKQTLENANPSHLVQALESRLEQDTKNLQTLNTHLRTHVEHRLEKTKLHLDTLSENLSSIYSKRIESNRSTLTLLGEKLKHLDPRHILSKGYSLTYLSTAQGRHLIRSSRQAQPGNTLTTILASGEITSVVETTATLGEKENTHPSETA